MTNDKLKQEVQDLFKQYFHAVLLANDDPLYFMHGKKEETRQILTEYKDFLNVEDEKELEKIKSDLSFALTGIEEATKQIIFRDEQERYIVYQAMQKYGGSFASALGVALMNADPSNTRKIKETWPKEWEEYYKRGVKDNEINPKISDKNHLDNKIN